MTQRKREAIWSYFLKVNDNHVEYFALRDKINLTAKEFLSSVDEVISLDVQRSYTNNPAMNQAMLKNVL